MPRPPRYDFLDWIFALPARLWAFLTRRRKRSRRRK